jgi:hypothetical protein
MVGYTSMRHNREEVIVRVKHEYMLLDTLINNLAMKIGTSY